MKLNQTYTSLTDYLLQIQNKASRVKARFILYKSEPSRLKSITLLALVITSLSASLPLFTTQSVSAATKASEMTPEEQVESFLYYRALGNCMTNRLNALKDGGGTDVRKRINQQHAVSGEWFSDLFNNGLNNAASPIGPYMRGILSDVGDDYKISCDQAPLIKGALSRWGNWAPDEALCAFGFRRASDTEFNAGRCTNAQQGSDEFKAGDNVSNKYQQAVKDRVYGGAEPSLPSEANYLFYLGAFQQSCAYGAQSSTTKPTGTSDRDYAIEQVQPDGNVQTTYYTGLNNKTKNEEVIVGPLTAYNANEIRENCGWLVDRINENTQAYAAYILKSKKPPTQAPGSTPVSNPDATASTSTCGVDGIGWIICPIANSIAGGVDGIFNVVKSFLEFKGFTANGGNALFPAWSVMRNFANVAFVIAFMIIIYSQLTSAGLNNYGIKKMLPRLIVAAILVNVSYWICAIAVDISNILGASLNGLFTGLIPSVAGTAVNVGWVNATGTILAGGAAGATALGLSIAAAGSFVALLWMLVPLLLGVLFSVLVAVIVLAGRQVLLILFIVIAPLAFVAYLLPNTQKWYEKWQGTFITLLLMYPIISVIFGASQFAAAIVRSNATDMTMVLLSLAIQTIPLAITPLVIKFSGGLLNRFAGMVNNPKRGPIDGIKNWAKDRQALATKKGLGSENPNFVNRMGQFKDRRRRTREGFGKVNENRAESLWQNSEQGRKTIDAQGMTNIQSEIDKNRASTRLKAVAPLDLTLEARVSKMTLDAAQSKEDTLVKAMSTNASNPFLDSLNPELRSEAQNAVLAKNISDSAGTMAQNVQTQEYAEKLRHNPLIAQAAGGIAERGVDKVRANAIATQGAATSEAIKHAVALLEEDSTPQTLIAEAKQKLIDANASGDAIQVRAAAQILRSTGAAGMGSLHEAIIEIESTSGVHSDVAKDLKYDISSAGIKGKDSALDAWATSSGPLSMQDLSPGSVERLNQVELAGQGSRQLENWASANIMTQQQAKLVIDAHEKGTLPLDPAKLKIFTDRKNRP